MPNDEQQQAQTSSEPELNEPSEQQTPAPFNASNAVDLSSEAEVPAAPIASADLASIESGPSPVVVEPGVPSEHHEPRPWLQPQPEKKSRKKLFISLAALIAVIIVASSSWAVYALWYQNPDKVVADAMINALNAKTAGISGSFNMPVSDDGYGFTATFDGKSGYKEGSTGTMTLSLLQKNQKTINLPIEGISTPDGNSYVKVSNLKQTIDDAIKGMSSDEQQEASAYESLLDGFLTKIDGKWLSISASSLRQVDPTAADEYDCNQKIISSLGTNKSYLKEIGDIYQKNRVFTIKQNLGSKEGDLGYLIDVNNDTAKSFVNALKTTQLYKDLKACNKDGSDPLGDDSSSSDGSTGSTDDNSVTRIEVWISQWSHQLDKIHSETISSEDGKTSTTTFDATIKLNVPVSVSAPSSSTSLQDALPDLSSLFGSESTDQSSATTST